MPEHSHTYKQLENFIRDEMRMSHIYQPVMLIKLLESSGKAKITDIAKSLLSHDQSQIEYYEQITKNMVGRVLSKNRGLTERIDDEYRLKGYEVLSGDEIGDLVCLCQGKIADYITRRGRRIWEHRVKSEGYISGTSRYEVLKRAKFRCELCGISADEKALEVDHIVPRNHGGTDDLPNYRPADLVAEMRLGRRLRIKVPRKTGHAQKIDVSSSKPRRVAGLEMPGVAWACLIRNANRAIIRD